MASKPKKSDVKYATAVTNLKYSPELATVRDLFTQARQQYTDDRSNAKENARATINYAQQAAPKVKSTFDTALASNRATQADTNTALAGLGSAADVFRAATTREQGGARSAIALAQANARQELTDRQLGATAGRALALDQAARSYARTKDTLSTRLQDITRDMGTNLDVELGGIADTRAKAQDKADNAAQKAQDKADSAAQKAAEKAAAQKAKDDAANTKRIEGVHKASGDFASKIQDAAGDWRTLANEKTIPITKPNPDYGKSDPTKNTKDKVIQTGTRAPTAQELKTTLRGAPYNYTPEEIHIALLVGNKPLDQRAIDYMHRKGLRIPRAWVRNQMDQAIAENRAAGPPRPGTV